jgi:hypothetical protein
MAKTNAMLLTAKIAKNRKKEIIRNLFFIERFADIAVNLEK